MQDFAGTHNAAKDIHGNAVFEEKTGNRRYPLSRIGEQNDFFAVFMKAVQRCGNIGNQAVAIRNDAVKT